VVQRAVTVRAIVVVPATEMEMQETPATAAVIIMVLVRELEIMVAITVRATVLETAMVEVAMAEPVVLDKSKSDYNLLN